MLYARAKALKRIEMNCVKCLTLRLFYDAISTVVANTALQNKGLPFEFELRSVASSLRCLMTSLNIINVRLPLLCQHTCYVGKETKWVAMQHCQYTLRGSWLSVSKYVSSEPEKATHMCVNFTTIRSDLWVQ